VFIDAHQHFWKLARADYPWMSPEVKVLYRDYLPSDLAPLLRRTGIESTIVVQATPTEAETEFLLDLATRTDFIAGVVGWLDFEDAAFPSKLDKLLRHPKFVGLRPMLQDLSDDAYILRPSVLDNLRHLVDRDVALDFLTLPQHLPYVLKALDMIPNLRGVIDHLSKPPIAKGRLSGWAENILRVAAYPRIQCKLSGLVTEANRDWTPKDLEPFVSHAFEAFGEDRMMFGSDWPVCLQAGSYAEVLNALRAILDPYLDKDGIAKVYGANAIKFYKLKGFECSSESK
jgi:L-fuconolactonase